MSSWQECVIYLKIWVKGSAPMQNGETWVCTWLLAQSLMIHSYYHIEETVVAFFWGKAGVHMRSCERLPSPQVWSGIVPCIFPRCMTMTIEIRFACHIKVGLSISHSCDSMLCTCCLFSRVLPPPLLHLSMCGGVASGIRPTWERFPGRSLSRNYCVVVPIYGTAISYQIMSQLIPDQ